MTQSLQVYRSVARLHMHNIQQGFLASLGERFLALMYECIDLEPTCVLLLAREGAEIVGFVAGSTNGQRPIMRRLMGKPFRLAACLLPALASPAKLQKIAELLNGGVSFPSVPLPTAELLSIAVAPAHRGRGHAQQLYAYLCEHFRTCGEQEFRIVVGDSLAHAHRFYRQMGAQPKTTIEVHKGQSSTVYTQACREQTHS